jgi:hypothetical protein
LRVGSLICNLFPEKIRVLGSCNFTTCFLLRFHHKETAENNTCHPSSDKRHITTRSFNIMCICKNNKSQK